MGVNDGSSDDANPYRPPAFVEEEDDEVEAEPLPSAVADDELDELRRLKAIERDGRHLVGVATAYIGSLTALLVVAYLSSRHLETELYGEYALVCGVACATTGISLLAVGTKLAVATGGRSGCVAAMGLLLPGLNVALAAIYLQSAIRALASRGVRFGWLACDYSRVENRRNGEG